MELIQERSTTHHHVVLFKSTPGGWHWNMDTAERTRIHLPVFLFLSMTHALCRTIMPGIALLFCKMKCNIMRGVQVNFTGTNMHSLSSMMSLKRKDHPLLLPSTVIPSVAQHPLRNSAR